MFLKDPKNSIKSVSLTILIVSFTLLTILGILQCFSVIKDTGPFMELFMIATSLYFGRRLNLTSIMNKGKK